MNTSKQVNVMLGLLLLTFLVLGAYFLNEGNRQVDAREHTAERNAERGARLFAQNCRTCHGLIGAGSAEGGFGAQLNSGAFLVLSDITAAAGVYVYDASAGELAAVDVSDQEPTPGGVADGIRRFLFDTIACGRTGTFMPFWAESSGGPLSDTQVEQLVTMIADGRWDLVVEAGHEADEENGLTEEEIASIVIRDPSALSPTANNCGQFSGAAAQAFRVRDPFGGDAAPAGTATPAATATSAATATPGEGATLEVAMTEFAITSAVETIEAGGVTFRTSNDGAILHELVVVRTDLAADALPPGAGVADETQIDVLGRIDQWPGGGEVRSITLDLTAGKYLLICNLPGHYALGMTVAFTVE